MKVLNLLLRFLLELSALATTAWWGLHAVEGSPRIALGVAAPLLFVLFWWLFAGHKAKFPPPAVWKAIVGFLLLEVTPLVLLSEGRGLWAGVLALVIAVNSGLVYFQKYQ